MTNVASGSRLSRRVGWALMAVSAVAIVLIAVPRYLTFDPDNSQIPMNPAYAAHIVVLCLHAITGGLALLIGPFQFLASVRRKRPALHRALGRTYLVSVLVGGVLAFFSALFSTSGLVAQVGLLILAAAWLYSAVRAYLAIRARQIQLHRIWMIRNYALTFAAVMLRVILLGGMLFPVSFSELYPISVWAGWTVPLLVAEWFIVQRTLTPLVRPRVNLTPPTTQVDAVAHGAS
jgi:uncharacterized membrane protein